MYPNTALTMDTCTLAMRDSTARRILRLTRFVARSTDGGLTFDQDATACASTNLLNMADVIVAPSNGYIYVTLGDFTASPQRIYLARSPQAGSLTGNWTVDSNGPTGYFFTGTTDQLNGSLRGVTVPMVRYNNAATKISVVWHEKESSTSHLADVYYSSKGLSGWQTKVKISNEMPSNQCTPSVDTDQFMPALDYDSSGNVIVTYYDRQADCNNNLYDLYFTKIDSSGTQLQAPTRASAFQSNPAINWFTPPGVQPFAFIGDYQQTWSEASVPTLWHASWIGAPNTGSQSDCYYTQIQ